jgi:methylated-DNA-[protein]-cysteine S-methyltransferase
MFYDVFQSPLGTLTIAGDETHIRELHIEGDRYFTAIPSSWVHAPEHALFKDIRKELTAYFNGDLRSFTVPLKFEGTDFQKQVWHELRNIPAGATITYAELALRINKPKAVRAVGTAVGKNPLCILIPCHRVLASSGGLGGYVAGLDRKRYLLQLESQL